MGRAGSGWSYVRREARLPRIGRLVTAAEITQFVVTGLTIGSIYALVGLGFNLIFNSTDVINFAQGEFVMLGGVGTALIAGHSSLPLWIIGPLAIVAVGLLGALIDFTTISRVRRGNVMTLVMITLGISVVIKTATLLIVGPASVFFPPFTPGRPLIVFGAVVQLQAIWVIGVAGAVMVALSLFYTRFSLGREMLACAIDREAAALMGINVKQMVRLSFFLSGCLGALAGFLITPLSNAAYDQGFSLALKGFAAAALGGFGKSSGAVLGGLTIGLLEAGSVAVISSGWKDAIALGALILVLAFRPAGIFGGRAERRHTQAM
jgi:branched-chain amino acid transport system permease protein